MVIFSQARGKVQRVKESRGAVPFRVTVAGKGFQRAIVTQAAIEHRDNFQFLHTIYDTVYVYVFGTRIGELVVSGVAFADTCWSAGSGAQEIMEFYNTNRIAVSGKTVQVVFGTIPFPAFLTGLNISVVDAEQNLSQWTYRFNIMPTAKAKND